MSEQEKKRHRIYDWLCAETKQKKIRNYWSSFVYRIQTKEMNFKGKRAFLRKEGGVKRIEQKTKRFSDFFRYGD